MKIVRKKPDQDPEIIEIENTLKSLQKEVGGLIEAIRISEDTCILCNEEGLFLNLKHNLDIAGNPVFGTILIVGTNGADFCDLQSPETFVKFLKTSNRTGGALK